MINQYTSIENNNSITNPTHTRIQLINVQVATAQRQESISLSLQRVLKTAGTIFTDPDLNCVTRNKKTMDFT